MFLEHMLNVVNNATLSTNPFAHLNVDGIFPDNVYQSILKNFPKKTAPYWKPLSEIYSNRLVIDLDKHEPHNQINQMSDDYKCELAYWIQFRKDLLHPDLMMCFLEKYKDFLPKKFWKNAHPTARLSLDSTPYSIGAHRDRDDKLVSVMLYTPPKTYVDEIADNYGTALLTPKDPNMKVGMKHYNLKLFNKVGVAKFRPNAMFSWAVTHDSFHGVYPLQHTALRPTISYFIRNRKDIHHNTKGRF